MKKLTINEIKIKDETETEIKDLDIERLQLYGKGNYIIKIEIRITL